MKHMVKFTALVCCSLAAASLFADPATGWKVGGITLGGALTVDEGNKITVNVALGAGEKLKSKQHVIVESTEQLLDIAKFMRGENCGNLKLSADGKQLLMTVQSGLALYIR